MRVSRYDLARFSPRVTETPQGFIRAPANFTRAGVFVYTRADGTEVRELRPDEEVFHEDSLATLSGAPVVELHPKEGMVTPANAKTLSVGFAGEHATPKPPLVSGTVTVFDAGAIAKVAAKELSEISLGYRCRIDKTSGTHPVYGRYDQIQRDIRYNHVALGPADWGRAGSEVSIRLDADGAILAKTLDCEVSSSKTDTSIDTQVPTMKIKIGGVECEVADHVGQVFAAYEARNDQIAKELASAQEALQGRFDAAEAKVKELQEALEKANDPERFDSAVQARINLEKQARAVLGEKVNLPATTREIHEAVLRHDDKELDLAGKSDEYVAARFDQRMASPPVAPKPGAARADARDAAQNPVAPKSVDARAKMIEESAQAWQKPLAVSNRS